MADSIETRHWINGEYVTSEAKFTLMNPSTGKALVDVCEAGEREVEAAVAAAAVAQKKWYAMDAAERATVMRKFAQLVRDNIPKLANLDAQSMGKPISHYFDGEACASVFDYVAGLGQNAHGSSSLLKPGFLNVVLKQPYDICAGILPWNVPAIMFAYKVAPCVAAGGSIIVKSSEKAPLAVTALAGLTKEAGFPDGLINVLSGKGTSGQLLSEHMKIRKISFTGSGRTGRLIMAAAAKSNLKACTLELGGKSPTLVFDDANLAEAIPACTFSIAWNSGQICVANSRIYVQAGIYDKFVEGFSAALGSFKHGDPTKQEAMNVIGPQADSIQSDIVKKYIEIGKKDGKTLLGGGTNGNFIEPTIFTNIDNNSRINKEEVFGPVVVVHRFESEEDALQQANDTDYGLYAAVYTQDFHRAIRVAAKLEAGSVGVNCTSPTHNNDLPFGGWKQSGIGREMGPNVLNAYLEEKTVLLKVNGL